MSGHMAMKGRGTMCEFERIMGIERAFASWGFAVMRMRHKRMMESIEYLMGIAEAMEAYRRMAYEPNE